MICLSQLSSLFSVPAAHFPHWLDNFHPTHNFYVLLKLLFNWRLNVQETGFSQQLQAGPENQVSLQGKHNTDSESQIQNQHCCLCFLLPSSCVSNITANLLKDFSFRLSDRTGMNKRKTIQTMSHQSQRRTRSKSALHWAQNCLSFLPTSFHTNHNEKPPAAAEVTQICIYLIIKNIVLTLWKIAVIF